MNFEEKFLSNVEKVFCVEDWKFLIAEKLKEGKINKHLQKST